MARNNNTPNTTTTPATLPVLPVGCLCGCGGEPASGDFLPGHDARLRSLFHRCLGIGRAKRKTIDFEIVARVASACVATPVRESAMFAPLVSGFVARVEEARKAA